MGLAILQLSFIDAFLSNAMKSGFTTAAAIATIITQLQFVLGFQRQDIRIGSSVFILPEVCRGMDKMVLILAPPELATQLTIAHPHLTEHVHCLQYSSVP